MSKYPDGKFERHPLNAPGPFYVEEGQCINCMAPCEKAPELFGFFKEPAELRGYGHCYIKRQPGTSDELGLMIQAFQASCCSGLRYCGNHPEILERLREAGLGSRCDELWDEDAGATASATASAPAIPPSGGGIS